MDYENIHEQDWDEEKLNTCKLKVGHKVWVFDHRLWVDDVKTPLSVTMQKATIVKIHHSKHGAEVADVVFDYREGVSKSHFIDNTELITLENLTKYDK